jgi:hypothetical protein
VFFTQRRVLMAAIKEDLMAAAVVLEDMLAPVAMEE